MIQDNSIKYIAKKMIRKLMHPEVFNNAENLFHCKNNNTIIEEEVQRDKEIPHPLNRYYLSDEDFEYILNKALVNIDPVIEQYDDRVALEDSLTKVISTEKEGRYAGKIDSVTYNCLLTELLKMKEKKGLLKI